MRTHARTFDIIRMAALHGERDRMRRSRLLTAFLAGLLFATTAAIVAHDARTTIVATTPAR